jgi:hypothetical protein
LVRLLIEQTPEKEPTASEEQGNPRKKEIGVAKAVVAFALIVCLIKPASSAGPD